jgi:hypothetical protein
LSKVERKADVQKFVSPSDAHAGQTHAVGGIEFKLVEVSAHAHPWGEIVYQIAYRMFDSRISPVRVFPEGDQPAVIWVTKFAHGGLCTKCNATDCEHTNVVKALKTVVDNYERIREPILGIKIPEVKVKGARK